VLGCTVLLLAMTFDSGVSAFSPNGSKFVTAGAETVWYDLQSPEMEERDTSKLHFLLDLDPK
jgi:hypothetical protein